MPRLSFLVASPSPAPEPNSQWTKQSLRKRRFKTSPLVQHVPRQNLLIYRVFRHPLPAMREGGHLWLGEGFPPQLPRQRVLVCDFNWIDVIGQREAEHPG